MALPLNLTERQKVLLANVAEEIARAVYDCNERHEAWMTDWDSEAKELGEKILRRVGNTESQVWKDIVDKLRPRNYIQQPPL